MNKTNDFENMSMFDSGETEQISINQNNTVSKLEVVKAEFIEIQTLTWEELFEGFDKLYAVTYSSSVDFICKLLKKFETAEIIFGFEPVMSNQLHEIFAYQDATVKWLKEKSSANKIDLISRIENSSLKMYAARDFLSHEKIYILESNDGRKRVIMGSANMSNSAFSGKQRENIEYFDSERLFDYYREVFEDLKESCVDNINSKALAVMDNADNIEEIPIANTVRIKKALVIEPQSEASDEIKFTLETKNLAGKYKAYTSKPDEKGKITLTPETFKQIKRKLTEAKKQEKKVRKEYPHFIVDIDEQTATLNEQQFDLNPNADEVIRDVALFLEYMNGFEKFNNDWNSMQMRYFEFANWFFATPFMPFMRRIAELYGYPLTTYPVFGIIYGQSNAGKTKFLETLRKMMIGYDMPIIKGADFTAVKIISLGQEVKGVPLIVDDLNQNRFREYGIEAIKSSDYFGIDDNLTHYPAVAISGNEDIKALNPEVIKRAVTCRTNARISRVEASKSHIVTNVQKNIGTAFYCEYLRCMLEKIAEISEKVKSEEYTGNHDILAESSVIICKIIKEHNNGNLPLYVRELTFENYFDDNIIGANSKEAIVTAWETNRKNFDIKKKANQLRYAAEDERDAERIIKELPVNLNAQKSHEWIIMDLEKSREFFGVNFKKGFWSK